MAPPEPLPAETKPDATLLRALGRLARGLSVLFWGLPIALIFCVQAAQTDFFQNLRVFPPAVARYFPPGLIPPALATGWLIYGLSQLGHFQKQERIWISALDRARLLALVNFGLSPFLYWWNQFPRQIYFGIGVDVLAVSGLAFLAALNLVIYRLSMMLPDEHLRQETRHFTLFNRLLVLGILLAGGAFVLRLQVIAILGLLFHYPPWLISLGNNVQALEPAAIWVLLFLVLLPLAVTMALIWKIKQVILDSVFGG